MTHVIVGPNEVRSESHILDYSDLLNTTVGAQAAVTIKELVPEGWEVKEVEVETLTAFNGSGTRALALGVTGSATAIFTGLDVKSAAVKAPSVTKYRATAPIAVIATLTTATDNPTAGKVRITLYLAQVMRED